MVIREIHAQCATGNHIVHTYLYYCCCTSVSYQMNSKHDVLVILTLRSYSRRPLELG